jgi:hypothetical protein
VRWRNVNLAIIKTKYIQGSTKRNSLEIQRPK